MDLIEIKTLIDITQTKVSRPNQGSQLELDQNRNFITLLQCAEIRSIVVYESSPSVEEVAIDHMGFGTDYQGKHKVWTFTFTPDREGVYTDAVGNALGYLLTDINGVPIIKNLTETINIAKAMFECNDIATTNTLITAHQGTI
jgi:microsomal dipeptidase-like Zn-dependent dipeptidase